MAKLPIREWLTAFCDLVGNYKAGLDCSIPGCVKLGKQLFLSDGHLNLISQVHVFFCKLSLLIVI